MSTTPIDRTIAAEARAVEEGHRAFLDGAKIRVKSDTTDRLYWLVSAQANAEPGSPIVFRCQPDDFNLARGHGHEQVCGGSGELPCKHAGVAVRRLEREGLARFAHGDGLFGGTGWVVTQAAADLLAERIARTQPDDPFEGL